MMLEKSKIWLSSVPKDVLFLLVSILAATGSFGLGMLAERAVAKHDNLEFTTIPVTGQLGAAASSAVEQQSKGIATGTPAAIEKAATVAPSGGKYVASKTGTRYYLPSCSSANRIKPENRVWFASKEEAEAAGLGPAANCPGL